MRQAGATPCCLAILLLMGAPGDADAATRTWTGPGSCTFSLQGCINIVSPGDIIRVATNEPILEDLTIDKSLTLRAAAGFTPLLDGVRVVTLHNPSPRANTIVFEGFTFTKGSVRATQQSEGSFDVTLRSLTFRDVSSSLPGIDIQSSSAMLTGAFAFSATDNEIAVMSGFRAIGVVNRRTVSMHGSIRTNRIDQFGAPRPVILVSNDNQHLDVDVIANDIRGAGYNNGVYMYQFGDGTSNIRMLDNLVVGQMSAAYALDVPGGNCTFEIVNNTAVHGEVGIRIAGRPDFGAFWSGIVANNIVAHMEIWGIIFDQPDTLTTSVVEEHNLLYQAPLVDGLTLGPGTLVTDPRFVGGQNFRLSASSPARNAGDDASVPTDLLLDLDGLPRRIGHVDMGAYESTITVSSPPLVADGYRLHPNVPNPFNPSTVIQYELPRAERVRLGVFDARGHLVSWLVEDAKQDAGPHRSSWDGRSAHGAHVPSGVYFYRLEAGPFIDSRRMVLAR